MPIGMSRRNSTPSSSRSSITSASTILACRSSSSVLTSGNITRTSPQALARRIARSCVLNNGRFCRLSRMLRSPKALSRWPATPRRMLSDTLSAPRSIVRITTGRPAIAVTTLQYASKCSSSVGSRVALQVEELRAIQADAVAAAVGAVADLFGELDVPHDEDPLPVAGAGLHVPVGLEPDGFRAAGLRPAAVVGEGLLVRVDQQFAPLTVDDDGLAAGHVREEPAARPPPPAVPTLRRGSRCGWSVRRPR